MASLLSVLPRQYNNVHRRFLQIMMGRRMVPYTDALDIFFKICSEFGDENIDDSSKKLQEAISLINKVIQRFHMEITAAHDEVNGEKYIIFFCTADRPYSKEAKLYTNAELEIFKRVLREIITAEGSTSSTLCLNMTLPMNITKSEVERILLKFCNDLWLVQKNGVVSLSPLCIAELGPFLEEHFADFLSKCSLCKQLVIQGSRCEHCSCMLHNNCMRRYVQRMKTPTCPTCENTISCAMNAGDMDCEAGPSHRDTGPVR